MTRGALPRFLLSAAVLALATGATGPRKGAVQPPPDEPEIVVEASVELLKSPGTPQYFGDWAVGCDNVLHCEAVSLLSGESDKGEPILLQIARDAGADGATTVRVRSLNILPPRVALVADGRQAARLNSLPGDEPSLTGPMALNLAKSLAQAVVVEVHVKKARGRLLGTPSTDGLRDALSYIDRRQGRSGTRGAMVRVGNKPDIVVPAAPEEPVIAQQTAPDADTARQLSAEELAAAHDLAVCDANLVADHVNELVPLDGESSLLLLPCDTGGYNVSAVALIARGTGAERSLSVARFDFSPGFTGEPGKPPLVVNALWDARRGILSSLAKGRGAGDCGASEDYVWDGRIFRLIERRAMQQCRGAWEWIRLWTARREAIDADDPAAITATAQAVPEKAHAKP